MYSTTAYIYQQKHQVILLDSSGAYFDRRYQPVYAKNLKINRGVDNVILIEFINQDQKPVNISGSEFTFRLISQDGTGLLISKDMESLNDQFGRAKVTITAQELDSISAQVASYSIERKNGELYEAVFVDDHAGGRGVVDIEDSVYPDFVYSESITVPDYTVNQIENPNRAHTSIVDVAGKTLTTFQIDFDNFTGNVKAQGSESQLGPWYDVGSQAVYVNQDQRTYLNVEGHHNYLRLEINQYGIGATATATVSNGAVTEISLASGGSEYLGPSPNVDIEGLGTGATATAQTTGNSVSSLALQTGGQGFVTEPNVTINTGNITHISYR